MSEAKKCDRCGQFFDVIHGDIPKYRLASIGNGHYRDYNEFDLCSDCMSILDRFITGYTKEVEVQHVNRDVQMLLIEPDKMTGPLKIYIDDYEKWYDDDLQTT